MSSLLHVRGETGAAGKKLRAYKLDMMIVERKRGEMEAESEVLNARGRLLLQPSLKSQSGQPLQLLKDINRRERKSSGKVTRLWMRSSERLSSRCMALGMSTKFLL